MPPRLPRGLAAEPAPSDSVWHLLLHTLVGRALLAGAGIRLLASLAQLATGPSTILNAIGAAGTLTLIAALGYLVWRLIALGRRRLLWRVRRKLILSYIFVGLVPVLLVIVFFALCGLLLFTSISSYVVDTRLRAVTEHAQFLAKAVAIELGQRPGASDLADALRRKQQTIESKYPASSMVLVPVTRTCGPAAPGQAGPAALRTPLTAGPWAHVQAPRQLPGWIGCTGFAGLMAYTVAPADDGGDTAPTRLFIRAVALPDGPSPPFAVILDVPINEVMSARLEQETGVELGPVTVQKSVAGVLPAQGLPAAGASPHTAAFDTEGRLGRRWVVFLDHTDWATGRTGRVTQSIDMRYREIYERLSPKVGMRQAMTFGEALMLMVVAVGVLFLIIQFVAIVMGLALARSITGSVHELFVGTERVRQGDFSHQIPIRTRDQLGDLADSFNGMTARLGQLLAEMTEKKRLEEELRIARSIQMSLLPQRLPVQLPGIAVTGLCAPAREVGGDYYDFLPLGERRLGLLIADVSGKGTSAAFYMAELKGLMLSLSRIHRSPRELLIEANRIITGNLDNRSFITMIYAVLDLDAQTMTFARAGHTPLLHLPGGAERRARVLVPDGLVLGLMLDDGRQFNRLLEEVTIPLVSGDLFMFFTDGLSEQMNPGEDLFGEARLGALIEEHGHLPFDELRERIVREVQAFAGGAAQHDDMTFILLRVEGCEPQAGAGRVLAEVTTA